MTGPRATRLIGRKDELAALRAAFDAGRHVLVEGPHGAGKSRLLAELTARSGNAAIVVAGSMATTAAALVGSFDPAQVLSAGYRPDGFRPGPLVRAMSGGRMLSLDEANRVPPDALNVLISALSEGEIAVPRYGTIAARPGFRIIASINPLDAAGGGPLPDAFRDRLVRLTVRYQDAADERAIVHEHEPDAPSVLIERAVRLVRASRRHPDVRTGASIRGAIDLVALTPRLRDFGSTDPELEAALLGLSARIVLRSGTERTVEAIIRELWAEVVIAERRATPGPQIGREAHRLPPSSIESTDDVGRPDVAAPHPDIVGWRPPSDDRAGPAGAISRATGGAATAPPSPATETGSESSVSAETHQALVSFVRSSVPRGERARIATAASAQADVATIARLAARIVVRRVRGLLPKPERAGGRLATVRYSFRSDDLDLDRTVAELVEHPIPSPEHIWVHDRVPRRRGVVLLLDVSGSMRGEHAIEVATAGAAAALAAGTDELAVVTFGTTAAVLKRADEMIPVDELVRRILLLRPQGLTDLAAGLAAGRRLLAAMRSPVQVAVAMTDGVQNQGGDPLVVARGFRRLDVLATTGTPWRRRRCDQLAAAGRGQCLGYGRLDDLPAALSRLLAG